MWQQFLRTAGASLAVAVGSAALLTWLNGVAVQAVVNRTGRASNQLWRMKPGLWFHESAHALVGRLFGLQIRGFSLRGDASGRTDGHVTFGYSRTNVWQRLGLFFAAGAPVWVSGGVILALGKWAFWPGQPWATLALATLDWRWNRTAVWLAVTVLLSFGARLSRADLRLLLLGLPWAAGLLVLVFAGLAWGYPAALAGWAGLNQVAFLAAGALVAVGAVLALVVRCA